MVAIASALRNRGKNFHQSGTAGNAGYPHRYPQLAARGLMQVHHILPQLDAHLAAPQLGWRVINFTIADIDLVVMLDFLAWIRESIPDTCPHLQAWQQRATASDSA